MKTAKDATTAKRDVIPTGAKRSGGIYQESADYADSADAPEFKSRHATAKSAQTAASDF